MEEEMMEPTTAGMIERIGSRPTMKDKLLGKKQRHEAKLKEVDDALAALEANPEIERVLNLVSKVI
jgi:chaperonin cofactor prefoldin